MTKSKFKYEVQSLVKNDVITEEIANQINDYYLSKETKSSSRFPLILGVLGSILMGSGIILILAHNWDVFSRNFKTIIAFTPLVVAQIITGFSIIKNKSNTWKEASGTLLFFTVGSCMALISQIYNIPGDLSTYLITWCLLCLPLIYLLKSKAVILLTVVTITYYAIIVGYDFMGMHSTSPWLYLITMVLTVPSYLHLLKQKVYSNFVSILNWLLPLSIIMVTGAFLVDIEHSAILIYMLVFGLLYNIGNLKSFKNQKLRRNGYLILGSLGTVITLLLSSFKWIWDELHGDTFDMQSQDLYTIILLLLISFGIVIYNYKKRRKQSIFSFYQVAFIAFMIVHSLNTSYDNLGVVVINAILFVLGLQTVYIGIKKTHFTVLNFGLIILTTLIVCRFFDTNIAFYIKGLIFLFLGLGFFITNYIMFKKKNNSISNLSN